MSRLSSKVRVAALVVATAGLLAFVALASLTQANPTPRDEVPAGTPNDSACPSGADPQDLDEDAPAIVTSTSPASAQPGQAQQALTQDPNIDLRPGNGTAQAAAALDAEASGVHLGLRWCVVEPVDVTPTNGESYAWSFYDTSFQEFLDEGIEVRSIRVIDAPLWAVGGQTCVVAMCPPAVGKETALKTFVTAVADRYGPSSDFGVNRLAFWNEPNIPKNWGRNVAKYSDLSGAEQHQLPRRYSDLLTHFYDGAKLGDDDVAIDAGEIASGSPQGQNGTRLWAEYFNDENPSSTGPNANYDTLTIHAYSQFPSQISAKIDSYGELSDVNTVAVTEFGWAVGSGGWRCVASEATQRQRFLDAVNDVRTNAHTQVGRLVWFSVIDNQPKGHPPKCIDNTNYYDAATKAKTNTYGLYKRGAQGQLGSFADAVARTPLRNAFRSVQP
jgi:Glycosyl hydrolase catalytic core